MKISEARRNGRESFRAARLIHASAPPANPYPKDSREHTDWNHGYTDAQYELTERIGNE